MFIPKVIKIKKDAKLKKTTSLFVIIIIVCAIRQISMLQGVFPDWRWRNWKQAPNIFGELFHGSISKSSELSGFSLVGRLRWRNFIYQNWCKPMAPTLFVSSSISFMKSSLFSTNYSLRKFLQSFGFAVFKI